MNIVNVLFNISQVLGLTIIHSLWQGMLIYFVLRMLLAFRLSALKKYTLSLASLMAFTGWFIYTLANEVHIYNWAVIKAQTSSALPLMLAIPAGVSHISTETLRYYYDIEQYLPYLTVLYITGILYHTGKLVIAYRKINAIKRMLIPDAALQATADSIAAMLNVSRTIRSGYSKMIDIPCITGFIKPVILLPIALLAMLSTEETEAVIMHEIAHIKRNDYIVNVAQQIISVMLFFNPFAWLINRIIDRERENCCDNIVVNTMAKPLTYAHALLKIEQNVQNEWRLALAATGKKHHLLTRIEYIMKTKKPTGSLRQVIATFLIFALATTGLTWLNPSVANGKISIKNIKPVISKVINSISGTVTGAHPLNSISLNQAKTANDTTKRSKVTNITGDQSNNYQLFGEGDPKIAELEAEIKKHEKLADSYKENAGYKAIKAKMYQLQQTKGYYDNDTLANIMNNISKSTYIIENVLSPSTGEDSTLYKTREQLGQSLGAYYNSKSFSKMNTALQKKYGIDPNKGDFNSPDYIKYQVELKSMLPEDVKNQTAELADISAKFTKKFTSPEWKSTFNDMKFWIDSMKSYYKTPHSVQKYDNSKALYDEYMKYQGEKSAYELNDTVKREHQLVKEYMDKLNDYISHHRAELVQQTIEWKNRLRTTLGDDYNVIVWNQAEKANQDNKK